MLGISMNNEHKDDRLHYHLVLEDRLFARMDSPTTPTLPDTFLKDFPLHEPQDFNCVSGDEDDIVYGRVIIASCTGDNTILFQVKSDLVKSPSVVNRLDSWSQAAPLHYAAMKGHLNVVSNLLSLGATVDIWNGEKSVTPLICAAAHGHLDVVKCLLEHGADVNTGLDDPNADTSLIWAVRRGHLELVRYLINSWKASQVSAVVYSETPIHTAVIAGNPKILDVLIQAKGRADLTMGAEKYTPLHLAVSGEYPNAFQCCEMLLKKCPDIFVNVKDVNGMQPLHLAGLSISPDPDIVRMLVAHGAEVNTPDGTGRTPLFYLVDDSSYALECMEILLLEGKCDPNLRDSTGLTPLHLAAFKEMAKAAEVLLMNGADFSIRSEGRGGVTALSLLLRRIPSTSSILRKCLDNAVSLSEYDDQAKLNTKQNCKVKVNFNYVVSSSPNSSGGQSQWPPRLNYKDCVNIVVPRGDSGDSPGISTGTRRKNAKVWSKSVNKYEPNESKPSRPHRELAKIKCLIDENMGGLLLHPVVHSFLFMKWQKAKQIFIGIFAFKFLLVVLFSGYVQAPYFLGKRKMIINEVNGSEVIEEGGEHVDQIKVEEIFDQGIPPWYIATYSVIVFLATINALMEVAQLVQSPKRSFLSLEPWIFFGVLVVMIFYTNPGRSWQKSDIYVHRTLAAAGLLLAWIDVWIYMGRFPMFGHSIRIFFKVLNNFFFFILPHFCLFAGFIQAFTLLFTKNSEYRDFPHTISKAIRIMAGDISVPLDTLKTDTKHSYYANMLMLYIYTAYVIIVGIVLMNLLIGLAVHDIQGIYKEASMHRLTKQTILLYTLESKFSASWVEGWVPRSFMHKYISLFHPNTRSKCLVFRPFDGRDKKLSTELKRALVKLKTDDDTELPRPKSVDTPDSRNCNGVKDKEADDAQSKNIEQVVTRLEIILKRLEAKEQQQKNQNRATLPHLI